MEPLPRRNNGGLAPILGWSNGSPSLSPAAAAETPPSSGIGPDSPSRTVSFGSDDFSPTLSSSVALEPPALCPSTPSVGPRLENGRVCEDKPRTVITDNPVYDNVIKFRDLPALDVDSICSSEESSEEEAEERSKVPDGGWGWVIVMCSLIMSMVMDGISFSFGLLYIEFLNHFGQSKSKTAWIGSLFMAVPLMSGPIGSALVDRYGCRVMTMVGGIVSGTGFVISSFVDSIEVMYLTFGVVAGIGLGFTYVTAVVSIAYWFDKKRALATGLGACGTGIGTFVYAPMTQFLIQQYGWRGTILLLAGTMFNMCVCGALMRDPEWWTQEQNKSSSLAGGSKSVRGTSSCGSISGRSGVESDFPGVDEIRKMLKSGKTQEYMLTTLAGNHVPPPGGAQEGEEEAENRRTSSRSVVNLPTYVRQKEKVPLEVLESLKSNARVYNVILENYPSLLLCRSISDNGKLSSMMDDNFVLPPAARVPLMTIKVTKHSSATAFEEDPAITPLLDKKGEGDQKPIAVISRSPKSSVKRKSAAAAARLESFRKQISSATQTSPHYLKNIRVHRNSVMYRGAMLNIHKYRLRASSCPNIYRNSMTTIAKETEEKWYSDFLELLKGMVDFSMFLEWHFLLMSIATILLFTWFIIPYFYLAELMLRNGYTEQEASTLLSIIGFTNFVGMIILGWAGDQPWMNVPKAYAVNLVLCGFSALAMPFFIWNYWLLMITVALFGLFFASNFSFTPPILVQLIPLERFTTAYGLILLCQGIGNLVGPPLGGLLFDITQSWDLSFYMAGIWIIVSGLLTWLIPTTKNRILWGSGSLEMDAERDKSSIA